VPRWAASNTPGRERSAPVNAPLSWPKSSLSRRVSAKAAQLTATNGRSRRGLAAWMDRATSSLPVPVSPVTSTVAWVGPTRSTRSRTRARPGLEPTISPTARLRTSRRRRAFSRTSSTLSVARATTERTWAGTKGLVMKSKAPRRMASTASSTVAKAVSRTTGSAGSLSRTWSRRSSPSPSGIF
jgi:hypothetical protein